MYNKTYLLVYDTDGKVVAKHEIHDKTQLPQLLETYQCACVAGKYNSSDLIFYLANSYSLQSDECIENVDLEQVRFKIIV